jgi:WD40 repeat protein
LESLQARERTSLLKLCVEDLGGSNAVRELVVDVIGERIIPCAERTLVVPSHPHEVVEWDAAHAPAGELRIAVDKKVVQVIEAALCSCAAFADAETLVSGSTDYTVRLWKLVRGQAAAPRPLSVNLTHIMRAHSAPVMCVTASRPWSAVVSGSQDGSAAIWDLNRGVYIRSIWHGNGKEHGVHLAAIQDSMVRTNDDILVDPNLMASYDRATLQHARLRSCGYTLSTPDLSRFLTSLTDRCHQCTLPSRP